MNKSKLLMVAMLANGLVACSGKDAPQEETETAASDPGSPVAVEAAGGNPIAEQAAKEIRDDYMRGIIVEISDDSYEGRGPGTAGDGAARKYLAERSESHGRLLLFMRQLAAEGVNSVDAVIVATRQIERNLA